MTVWTNFTKSLDQAAASIARVDGSQLIHFSTQRNWRLELKPDVGAMHHGFIS